MSFDLKNRIRRGTEVEVSIPFDQGNVFRPKDLFGEDYKRSQSLSIRAMSFDTEDAIKGVVSLGVSIPFDQGNVFRQDRRANWESNWHCLNPFRSGQCLSTLKGDRKWSDFKKVSIPFDQGNVFRHIQPVKVAYFKNVSIPFDQGNVFRHGICSFNKTRRAVSIPFDQGNVFRP